MNPKRRGEISEAEVIPIFMKRGYTVNTPFGENSRYDLVIDNGEELLRGQVKTAQYSEGEGVVKASIQRTHYNSDGNQNKEYSNDDIDIFIIYSPELDEVYQMDVEEAGSSSIYIRVEEPERWSKSINWHEDYKI